MQQDDRCPLCEAPFLTPIINHALYDKYSSSQNFYFTKEINEIVEEEYSKAGVQFKQYNYIDDEEEYLKREYGAHEYHNKIQMLSEYYKFHRDIIPCFDLPIEKILNRYYNRVREYDYKKIKNILKAEQNISLTTQKTQSSIEGSSFEPKSRYSTVLNELNEDEKAPTDSKLLEEICWKIDKAFGKVKTNNDFKGVYSTGHKQFQQFIMKEKANKKKLTNFQKITKLGDFQRSKKFDSGQKIKVGVIKPLKGREIWKKSMEKTTANDTISREQRFKKAQKNQLTNVGIKNILLETNQHLFKPVYTNFLGLKSNKQVKTIDEIYRPQNYNIDKNVEKKRKLSITSHKKSRNNLNTSKKYQPLKQFQHHDDHMLNPLTKNIKPISKRSTSLGREIQSSEKNLKRIPQSKVIRTFSSKQLNHKNNGIIKYQSSDLDRKKTTITMEKLLEKKLDIAKKKNEFL